VGRNALVIRNRLMTEAYHRSSLTHRVRETLVEAAARMPFIPCRTPHMERILLIRPDHLGDVLLTTPAIRALRAARPEAELHALIGGWSADVLGAYPEIDLVLTLDFPGFTRTAKQSVRSPYQLALATANRLRRIGYSSAVILRPDHWWGALVAKLAGIPVRVGYDLPQVSGYLTERIPHTYQHAVKQNTRLVARWTGLLDDADLDYGFPIKPEDTAYVEGYLDEWGVTKRERLICIHAGSGTTVKQWPAERWSTVADTLTDQLDGRIVLTGGEHEVQTAMKIAEGMTHQPIIMAGDTRVGQLAALFARASLTLGPDSGPLHLAAAVGSATVTLFGPADPVEFGPWGPPERHAILTSDIGCRPCRVLDWSADNLEYHPCVREITVARVLEAARTVSQRR
jgi:lipopolysaccharide heptosyltransferase II